jgi:hypothetical protein
MGSLEKKIKKCLGMKEPSIPAPVLQFGYDFENSVVIMQPGGGYSYK